MVELTPKIIISKPNKFSECGGCAIAQELINKLLCIDGIPGPFVSAFVKKVIVDCDEKNSNVTTCSSVIYSIQYTKNRKSLDVEGEGETRWNVTCPHFCHQ